MNQINVPVRVILVNSLLIAFLMGANYWLIKQCRQAHKEKGRAKRELLLARQALHAELKAGERSVWGFPAPSQAEPGAPAMIFERDRRRNRDRDVRRPS